MIHVTVLSENTEYENLEAEHGFCALIDFNGRKILLDAGRSGLFAQNAKKLGVDLSDTDMAVLSHSHYDHADGFDTFFENNKCAKLYLNRNCDESCYSGNDDGLHYIGPKHGMLEKYKDRLVYTNDTVYECDKDVFLLEHSLLNPAVGEKALLYVKGKEMLEPDMFVHEQILVVRGESGLVIFNSCSHTGAANSIKEVRMNFPTEKIAAYIGGFHLFRATEAELAEFAQSIKDETDMTFYMGHCTGENAIEFLKENTKCRIVKMHVGMKIDL